MTIYCCSNQAVLRRPLEPEQYTSIRFTQRLANAGVAPSTGSVGDSYDNAMAESFFGSLKTELIYRHTWTSRHDAELAIFAWIEGWYNPECRRTTLAGPF